MYKVKWTQSEAEIFRFLCIKSGFSFNLRGIARPLGMSPTGVSNALKKLEKEKIIKIEKSKTMNLFSIELNRDNPLVIGLKRAENLRLIYESGLYNFLYESFPGGTVILFGSYSKGEDVWGKSDIDIAVIGIKSKEINLTEFDKKLERTVIINFYHSWKDIHKHLRESILTGIVLKGGIEL